MEWVVKLGARSGLGEIETVEVVRIKRRVVGLIVDEIGLTLEEGKGLLGELAWLVLQTQVEEFATCAQLYRDCLKPPRLRDSRTRKIQTLFGTVTIDAPRIRVCPCMNDWGFVDMSWSPLTELLLDRCTPELRRLHGRVERQALLPRSSSAADHPLAVPADEPHHHAQWNPSCRGGSRVAHGYHLRHVDVTVGKIELPGRRRGGLLWLPKGPDHRRQSCDRCSETTVGDPVAPS